MGMWLEEIGMGMRRGAT